MMKGDAKNGSSGVVVASRGVPWEFAERHIIQTWQRLNNHLR